MVVVAKRRQLDKSPPKWPQYVHLNKYFRTQVQQSKSAPAIGKGVDKSKLSLSWQLACVPVDKTESGAQGKLDELLVPGKESTDKQTVEDFYYAKYLRITSRLRKPMRQPLKEDENIAQDLPKILVVDGATSKRKRRKRARTNHNDKDEAPAKLSQQTAVDSIKQRCQLVQNAKKIIGVPLCRRPTVILGPEYSTKRNKLDRELLQQLESSEHELLEPAEQYLEQDQLQQQRGYYAVPTVPMLKKFKKGVRYCGNFYYNPMCLRCMRTTSWAIAATPLQLLSTNGSAYCNGLHRFTVNSLQSTSLRDTEGIWTNQSSVDNNDSFAARADPQATLTLVIYIYYLIIGVVQSILSNN